MLVTMHQLQYLPWMGLIQRIREAEVFIISDTAPYSHNDYQNRNRIKTPNGLQWLTIPVYRGQEGTQIRDVKINNETNWRQKHWRALQTNYGKAKYFKDHDEVIESLYLYQTGFDNLAECSLVFLKYILASMQVKAELVLASDLKVSKTEGKTEWIIDKPRAYGYTTKYLSGGQGATYLDLNQFRDAGIWVDFHTPHISEYRQLWGEFTPYACSLDYLFNCIPRS